MWSASVSTGMRMTLMCCMLHAACGFHFPQELTDSKAIDSILDRPEPSRAFTFNVFLEHSKHSSDGAMSFLELATGTRFEANDIGIDAEVAAPINCRTVCKPVEKEEPPTRPAPTSFLEVAEERVCNSTGGRWSVESKDCEPFMRASFGVVGYEPKLMFETCQLEFGEDSVPCNPHQAVGLSNLYGVPSRDYFWLWPGGRSNQVSRAALKQDIGNNPSAGMDKCPSGHHASFYHNWDSAHVDSWACISDDSKLRVLCCGRR